SCPCSDRSLLPVLRRISLHPRARCVRCLRNCWQVRTRPSFQNQTFGGNSLVIPNECRAWLHTYPNRRTSTMSAKPSRSELDAVVLARISSATIVDFHRGLVQIPSVNPPGDCVEAIAYVEKPFAEAGFEIEKIDDGTNQPNLIAKLGPTGAKKLLI